MMSSKVLQLLLLVSSVTSQVRGMLPPEEKGIVEGIAQKIEELPKELRYKIFSSALALRENPKYEVYKKFDVGSEVRAIALGEDNTRLITGSDDEIVRIWDVKEGKLLQELKDHTNIISSVALSTYGNIALTSSWDGKAQTWDINTGELIKTLQVFQVGSEVESVALSADGTIALTGCIDSIARLFNARTGRILKEFQGHSQGITSVALSFDGTSALTGSDDGTARVWNTLTGELLKTLPVNSSISSVALSADGTIAIIGCDGNKALVWDVKSGALLNTLLTNEHVYSVAVSKDGKRALTGTYSNIIQVWNTKPLPGQKETSTPLTVLEGHTGSVYSVAFGSDDVIASGSYDCTALIWEPFALEPRGPQEHEEVLRQAYKETFSRPKFLFPNEK